MAEEKHLCTDVDLIPEMVATLRKNFYATSPTSLSYRKQQLEALGRYLDDYGDQLSEACTAYYGGTSMHHWLLRLGFLKTDVNNTINSLEKWMKPEKKTQNILFRLSWSATIDPSPLGVVSIIGPWNFPIMLMVRPLIGAIAAGNAVILKPSEVTDKVARLLAKIPEYLDPKMVQVVCGGVKETTVLLKQKFDFVLFTGAGGIGKIVMSACAKNLTPCCLELGGKNPVVIDDNADLDLAMKRVLWGRLMNGGQICVAPEYVFISRGRQEEAIALIRKYLKKFYGDTASNKGTEKSDFYYSIVNKRHFDRVSKLRQHYLESAAEKIAIGGEDDKEYGPSRVNEENRHLPPMVLKNVDFDTDKIMEDEVFGPILSFIPMDGTFEEWRPKATQLIQSADKPLAFYVFSSTPKSKAVTALTQQVSAGTVCVNDTIFFLALDIPFGGVGESGMGCYGGKYSFDTFSQQKPIAVRSQGLEFLNDSRYPSPDIDEDKLLKMRKFQEKLVPSTKTSTLWTMVKIATATGIVLSGSYAARRYSLKDIKKLLR